MLTCADCKDNLCPSQGTDIVAHDDCFTTEEVGASAPAPLVATQSEILECAYRELLERVDVLENQFDKLVDGLRKAAMEAWDV